MLMLLCSLMASADPVVQDTMQSHNEVAEQMRDALVKGDLTEAKKLATAWSQDVSADRQTTVLAEQRLQAPIAALAAAESIHDATAALGQLGLACGSCHTENDVAKHFDPPAPATGSGAMLAHDAALRFLWTGLVADNNTMFQMGAAGLGGADFSKVVLSGSEIEKTALALEGMVQDAAKRAADTDSREVRGKAFGEMVATCAGCHVVTRGGPGRAGNVLLPMDAPLVAEMHQRYQVVVNARQALTAKDLGAANDAGKSLLDLPPPTGLPVSPWRPWVVDVRMHAETLSKATNLPAAAEALTQVATSCGGCHGTVGGGPRVSPEELDAGLLPPMELLWLSLITDDEALWTAGAAGTDTKGLAEIPMGPQRASAYAKLILK